MRCEGSPRGRQRWAWAAALLVLAGCGSAPPAVDPGTHVVAGRITDEAGRPLPHASVVLSGTPRGAVADDDGTFAIDRLRPGRVELTVLHLGHRSAPAPLRIPVPENTSFILTMSVDASLGPARPDSLARVRVDCRAGN